MGDLNWDQIEQIVDEVLDLPPKQRFAYIEKECSHDQQLKSQVTQLVESIYDSDGWLEGLKDQKVEYYSDISNDLEALKSNHDFIDQKVGAYTIREQIGEGGMGRVYLAERSDGAFEHKVAIKIIRHTQATQTNIQRFEREQRILAGLNHSAIAQLYDGGITDEGFPYIIMEYISGVPFLEYCQENNLSLEERINLFTQVLEAVRYAHENLIIHRDLKPDNILVDENGNVKILDFGISKLLEDEDDLSLTRTGTRILTPKYAAPEQIKQQNITTATDLYSLGVIFYELLCEHPPFDLTDRTTYEAEQIILTQHPDKPSIKAPSKQKSQAIRGDLNAIALKAIRKEPDQRYRVATEFLDDLDHYLHDIPVSARTNSFQYRSSKFIGRHKKSLTTAGIVVVLIIGLTGYYTSQVTKERNKAQLQKQHAEEITNFLLSLFNANKPRENLGEDPPVSTILERGVQKIESEPISSKNKAILLGTIGQIELKMGKTKKSEETIKKAYNIASKPTIAKSASIIDIFTIYANWHQQVGNPDSAIFYFKKADSLHNAFDTKQTSEYRINLSSLANLYNENQEYRQALSTLKLLAGTFNDGDEESLFNKAYYLNNQAIAYSGLGDYDQALKKHQESLNIKKEIFSKNNPQVALTYHNMAKIYLQQGNNQKAYDLYKKALEIRRKVNADDHSLIGSTLQGVAITAGNLGKNAEAEHAFQESIVINKKQHGTKHYRYAISLRNYAQYLIKVKQFAKAKTLLNTSQDIITEVYGRNHSLISYITDVKGKLYEELNNTIKAEKFYTQTATILEENYGPEYLTLANVRTKQGILKLKQTDYDSALDKFKMSETIFKKNEEIDSFYSGKNQFYMGKVYFELGQFDLARDYLEKAYNIFIDTKGKTYNLALNAKKLLTQITSKNS